METGYQRLARGASRGMTSEAIITKQQHTIVRLETLVQEYSDLLHEVLNQLSQYVEVENEEIRLKDLDGKGGIDG